MAGEARSLAETVEHDPAALAALEERLGDDLRARAPLRRRRGGGHRPWRASGRRGRAPARARRRARATRRRRRPAARRDRSERRTACPRPRAGRGRADGRASGPRWSSSGFQEGVVRGRARAGGSPVRRKPAVELDGDAVAFDASGVDEVVYRLAPNPGEPPRPLARIASGGELSRVALAIKQVLAEADETPHARVRRGRHRASAAGAPTRSAGACGRWPAATRSCASRTCPRSPRTPTPSSASRSANATAGPSPRSSGSTARAGSSSSPQMLGSAATGPGGTTAAGAAGLAAARELLDRAEAWRGEVRDGRLTAAAATANPARWPPDRPRRARSTTT